MMVKEVFQKCPNVKRQKHPPRNMTHFQKKRGNNPYRSIQNQK